MSSVHFYAPIYSQTLDSPPTTHSPSPSTMSFADPCLHRLTNELNQLSVGPTIATYRGVVADPTHVFMQDAHSAARVPTAYPPFLPPVPHLSSTGPPVGCIDPRLLMFTNSYAPPPTEANAVVFPNTTPSPTVIEVPEEPMTQFRVWAAEPRVIRKGNQTGKNNMRLRVVGSRGTRLAGKERRKGNKPLHYCPFAGCGGAFTSRTNLKGHCDSHIGLKRFACHYCDKAFPYKHGRVRHEKTCKFAY
ncbi:hypothetical protein BDN72DRAFT_592369 [Pluteus cervinus]|uniref:Uncharacterized protein n=1 Tax=Pluteus cervinus TaxID=181527 RepID=A0ACD3AVA2_9AGAR|nr:hypothetical protein BDN72DRAFT_592369 [Pluteus cervinus]